MSRNYKLWALILIGCVGVIACCVYANDYLTYSFVPLGHTFSNDPAVAYQRGDYNTALSRLRVLADKGDAEAQYNLGVMYHDGQGVPQDYAQTLIWCGKDADCPRFSRTCRLGSH